MVLQNVKPTERAARIWTALLFYVCKIPPKTLDAAAYV